MYKVVYLVEKRGGISDEAFVEHWRSTHATLAQGMPGLRGYSINLPAASQRGPRPRDGYAALWFDTRGDAVASWASAPGKATAEDGSVFMENASPLVVDEIVVAAPAKSAKYKVVYLVEKRRGMSDEAFVKHWTSTHATLAQRMPGLRGYSINLPSPSQRGPRPRDGYAALWFDSREDAVASWASAPGQATAEDGAFFMAKASPLVVDEIIVVGPEREGQA